jgi:hypothetical protein
MGIPLTRYVPISSGKHHNSWIVQVGTYNAAVLAARHKIPFIVVAPISTVDLNTEDGSGYVNRIPSKTIVVNLLLGYL